MAKYQKNFETPGYTRMLSENIMAVALKLAETAHVGQSTRLLILIQNIPPTYVAYWVGEMPPSVCYAHFCSNKNKRP